MNRVKKGLDNQAIGLLPLLLFMFLDNYFSYLLSFIIGVTFCFVCIFLFQVLSEDKVYQFMLLPSAGTLVLYSVFLCLKLEPVLFIYSPLITGITGRGVSDRGVHEENGHTTYTRFETSLF